MEAADPPNIEAAGEVFRGLEAKIELVVLELPETRLVLNLLKGDNLPLPVGFSDEFSTFNEQSEDVLEYSGTFLGLLYLLLEARAGEAVEAGGGVTKMAVGLTQV